MNRYWTYHWGINNFTIFCIIRKNHPFSLLIKVLLLSCIFTVYPLDFIKTSQYTNLRLNNLNSIKFGTFWLVYIQNKQNENSVTEHSVVFSFMENHLNAHRIRRKPLICHAKGELMFADKISTQISSFIQKYFEKLVHDIFVKNNLFE